MKTPKTEASLRNTNRKARHFAAGAQAALDEVERVTGPHPMIEEIRRKFPKPPVYFKPKYD